MPRRRRVASLAAGSPPCWVELARLMTGDLRGRPVLLVDDAPDNVELLAVILEQCGAAVHTATSAVEALAIYRRTDIELVVSDLSMPVHDGYWLLELLQMYATDAPRRLIAVAVTGLTRESAERALAVGFKLFLRKPVEPDTICRSLAAVLAA